MKELIKNYLNKEFGVSNVKILYIDKSSHYVIKVDYLHTIYDGCMPLRETFAKKKINIWDLLAFVYESKN